MVLLLGATGLLGRNVLQVLLERGIEVRALVRSSLDVPGVDIVRGSILSKEDLMAAAGGCSAIINCAGTTDMALPAVEDFLPVNRDLPAMLCEVATLSGINVLVHTSTANTIVTGTSEHPSDENAPFGPPYDKSPYAISKKAGEDALLEYGAAHPELRIVIVNPGFMLGAYDSKPSSGQLVLLGWKKPLVFVTRGAKSILHVKDAANAIANALEKGSGRYLLTGECIKLKDYYRLQAKVCGYRQLCLEFPNWIVDCIGRIGHILGLIGIHNDIYPHNVRQLEYEEWYSCARARRELGYTLTPVEDAIRDFVEWYFRVEVND